MRRTGPCIRFAAAGLAAVVALAVPATAMAASTTTTTTFTNPINLVVVPFVDCITANADGSKSASFGYYSFAQKATVIAKGPTTNVITAPYDGPETTTFQPGYVASAFVVKIAKGAAATWSVMGFPANAPNAGSPNCATGGHLNVVGFVSCTTLNKDLSTTALYGYFNSLPAKTVIAKGVNNNITPVSFEGPEPTTFQSGLQPGIFPLTIPKGGSATWTVNGFPATAPNTWSPKCPPPVQLPQEGNGLGLVIGLLVAGIGGTFLIRRIISRAAQPA